MIKSVTLKNFRPYRGEHVIPFRNGITCIQGANRSGKTELLSAIAYAFYGGTSNGSPFPTNGETSFSVKVEMDDGTVVERGSDGARLNGEITTHPLLTAHITEQLGMTKDELMMTLWTLKGDVGGFLAMSPIDQKRFLIGITQYAANWDTIASRIQSVVYRLSKFITVKEARLETLSRNLEGVDMTQIEEATHRAAATIDEIKYELELNKDAVEADQKRQRELQRSIDQLTQRVDQVRKHNQQAEMDEETKKVINQKLRDVASEMDKMPSEPTLRKRCTEAHNTITRIETEMERLNKYLKRYKTTQGKCPIMDETCPHETKLHCLADDWKNTLDKLAEDMDNTLTHRTAADTALDKYHSLVQKTKELRARLYELKSTDRVEEPDTANLVIWMDELAEVEARLRAVNYNQLYERLMSAKDKHSALVSTHDSYYQMMKEKTDLEEVLVKFRDKLKEISVAAELTQPMGIPYQRTFTLLEKLELYTNTYLNLTDIQIRILPYRVLQSLASHCPVDGVEYLKGETECRVCRTPRPHAIRDQIEITTERGTTLGQESSGCRVLVSLALRFGLFEMLRETQAGKKCWKGLLALDEVFGYLDEDNKINCLSMIQAAKEKLGIDQVFIISNVDGLPDIDNWIHTHRTRQSSAIET